METELQRIERLVASKGVKLADFKREIGISPQTYNQWKTRGVPKSKIIELAEKFGVDPVWLATGVEGKSADAEKALINIEMSISEKPVLPLEKRAVLANLYRLLTKDINNDDVTMLDRVILNTDAKYHAHA